MPLSAFHPAVAAWFRDRLGSPTPPQREGWRAIAARRHTLIAAPTGSGKTLAAFLWAVDRLLRRGAALEDRTEVLYVSPLKALAHDVQRNLLAPLGELRAREPAFAAVRVLVRTGDTPGREREAMRRRPPHILVTTPESLYILLTSGGGRAMLRTVRTAIVDEIHAVAGDKRGAHLALSLERLEALTGTPPQRIGLSATQRPVEAMARLLAGTDRECAIVDTGHRRDVDLAIELPGSPLGAVCSEETWEEIARRMAALVREHRTTLVFVNTRKLAERVAARLARELGTDAVASHHGSLARERRLAAEQRLKAGQLRALVATASLELGIDVGDVDLAIQVGVPASIATFLQRVGRSGHGVGRTPKGRIFPLTRDELVIAAALLDAARRGELDRTVAPQAPLDILAQQIVAACVAETWKAETLYQRFRRAWPYRELARETFDEVVALHTGGRHALLHRDRVTDRLRATRRARLPALTSGGAIPDTAEYEVRLEPEGTPVGSLDEDFAVEANVGDIFQLGNASWQVLKVEPGVVRVADAAGAPPTIPFWFGEAPARTRELSEAVSRIRSYGRDPGWLERELGLERAAAVQLADYLGEGASVLGTVPSTREIVLERFFDESGGMQLVLHAPFGGRILRAWGLALRKRFCRGFGFELQAAATEDAILLSLGPQHSFPLEEVFDYLRPETVRDLLVQALLPTPAFRTRWRWNVTRALVVPRTRHGRRVPAPLLRMRAEDALVRAFPEVLACGETLPAGDLPVPWSHPLVRQTLLDCLHEAMDVEGLVEVLQDLRAGRIARRALDTPVPSAFAAAILNAKPYAFLDDAPLEERRTQAVGRRRGLDPQIADRLGALDPEVVARVVREAWPEPQDEDELHETLQWIGYLTDGEIERSGWNAWIERLRAQGRAVRCEGRWYAADGPQQPKAILQGRLAALGPVIPERLPEPIAGPEDRRWLLELEREGAVLRCRYDGAEAWCDRRLLARIHQETLERLRREIEPVTAAEFWRFLYAWQHAAAGFQLEGPRGLATIVRRLAGWQAPAARWESQLFRPRLERYLPQWLDGLGLGGEVAFLRLWGAGRAAPRAIPVTFVPREELGVWRALAARARDAAPEPSSRARRVLERLRARGPSFQSELGSACGLLEEELENALVELVALGLASCDAFAGLRRLLGSRRRRWRPLPAAPAGRWFALEGAAGEIGWEACVELAAGRLLERYGVVFRALLVRERIPVPWRDLARAYRLRELQGSVRGGRFVQRFAGEQYALPEAVALLRRLRRCGFPHTPQPAACDPLDLEGVLAPRPPRAVAARPERAAVRAGAGPGP